MEAHAAALGRYLLCGAGDFASALVEGLSAAARADATKITSAGASGAWPTTITNHVSGGSGGGGGAELQSRGGGGGGGGGGGSGGYGGGISAHGLRNALHHALKAWHFPAQPSNSIRS